MYCRTFLTEGRRAWCWFAGGTDPDTFAKPGRMEIRAKSAPLPSAVPPSDSTLQTGVGKHRALVITP